MRITWYGHAAFLVEGEGVRIIMDPFGPSSGYDPIDETADILTMSQEDDRFHSHAAGVLGDPVVLNGREIPPEGVVVRGILFRAVRVWEDLDRRRNPNGMFFFTLEGVRIAHMGDLGHPLNEDEIAPLRGTDILLALAGGPPTIAIPDLHRAVEAIQPRIVIPMHYQTGKVRLNIRPVDDFLAAYPAERIERHDSPTLDVRRETLPRETKIVVLRHAR